MTKTERGLPHLHCLPPSLRYLTWILYKIKPAPGVGEKGGKWCVLKLDQWRTENHANPTSTVTCKLTTFLHARQQKKRWKQKIGQTGKKKKKNSFSRAWSTKIEQIQCLSYLSIPSHSSTHCRSGWFQHERKAIVPSPPLSCCLWETYGLPGCVSA